MDGIILEAEYREESGVGGERVLFCGVSDEVDPSSGLLCSVFGDVMQGDVPLFEVALSPESSNRELIEDYKQWFRQRLTI